jgi:hypothetical protein
MGHQKIRLFRTDLKNVKKTFVKSAPKKKCSQKTMLPIEFAKVLKK